MRGFGRLICRQFVRSDSRPQHSPMEDGLWTGVGATELFALAISQHYQHSGHCIMHIE